MPTSSAVRAHAPVRPDRRRAALRASRSSSHAHATRQHDVHGDVTASWSPTPGRVVTASAVRITPCTIHGWRPTSVTIHPVSMATNAAGPATPAARRNHSPVGQPAPAQPADERPQRRAEAAEADRHHQLEREVHGTTFGRSAGGTASAPHHRVGVAVREPGQPAGDLDRARVSRAGRDAADVQRRARLRVPVASIAASFAGWLRRRAARAGRPTSDLDRRDAGATTRPTREAARW